MNIQETSNPALQNLVELDKCSFDALSSLSNIALSESLTQAANSKKNNAFGSTITYSPKVFIPLTFLCRDVCHYCTFAKTPKKIESPYLSIEQVVAIAKEGEAKGCHEALFTLGDKPELRYKAAREALKELGYNSTNEYLAGCAQAVLDQTSLIPHLNPGCLTPVELSMLKPLAGSMGLMIESLSTKLLEKGQPHHGSPDKDPAFRLKTLIEAGKQNIPFTTGILIGIGETRLDRLESIYKVAELHEEFGHIQEFIVQNFKAKPDTLMVNHPEPSLDELIWTIAMARLILPSSISVQVPPNLNADHMDQLLVSGINDLGGISPVTKDYVNPEAPWPLIETLAKKASQFGQDLRPRTTLYPNFFPTLNDHVSGPIATKLLQRVDASCLIRSDDWQAGVSQAIPKQRTHSFNTAIKDVIHKVQFDPDISSVQSLLEASDGNFHYIASVANELKQSLQGSKVSYVINRNINYTNICSFSCNFCAFSKGKGHDDLRGKAYNISHEEIVRRSLEAIERGATEVCLQGGIHPHYTGQTYLDIVRHIRAAAPTIHIHAFSPLEIDHGRSTLGISTEDFLQELKAVGLNSLPGTAAEILHDEVRAKICPDKLSSNEWIEIIKTAHKVGLPTTSTMMFGHVERMSHVADHLLKLRNIQLETEGITEFVPLAFVAQEAPIFRKGLSRSGPTFKESVLVHAVARILFYNCIDNIQGSWVKMGLPGLEYLLSAGINDIGGVLMNESITKAAGASFGDELSLAKVYEITNSLGLHLEQRNTLYQPIKSTVQDSIQSLNIPVIPIINDYIKPTRAQ